jgi:hypothetical protein
LSIENLIAMSWKMPAFNHELRSERITIERVLGMIVQRSGILG